MAVIEVNSKQDLKLLERAPGVYCWSYSKMLQMGKLIVDGDYPRDEAIGPFGIALISRFGVFVF